MKIRTLATAAIVLALTPTVAPAQQSDPQAAIAESCRKEGVALDLTGKDLDDYVRTCVADLGAVSFENQVPVGPVTVPR
ncbi:MAG: hypothetical protein KDG50_05435 [Chromatiales bacterium]|nr:hypothetical protein [Chromatiales bacterium]